MVKCSIAIIGSGVAGLTAAYLLDKHHDITLIEKNDYIGGHTHTITVNRNNDRGIPVDTGFIVMNHRTYPNFTKLLDKLNVELRDSDMSFGYYDPRTEIQYASFGIVGFFNKFRNIFKRTYYRIFREMMKFHRDGKKDLAEDRLGGKTLGEYLHGKGFSKEFIDHHIIPMGSAVWSTPSDLMLEFPAESFIRFLTNHGLMSLTEAPQWRTVKGGSHSYVKKILSEMGGTVFKNKAVQSVERGDKAVNLKFTDGTTQQYDKVIIATHADEAYKLLKDPDVEETRLLQPWAYNENRTVLHCDDTVMPQNRRIWASWNFTREKTGGKDNLCLTYHMNRLQGFKTVSEYFVTLNTNKKLDPEKIIEEMIYHHPIYTLESMATQKDLPKLNGVRNTFFCGSYFNYGFHEDAVTSALAVCEQFGVSL